jgi:hypothetical protein
MTMYTMVTATLAGFLIASTARAQTRPRFEAGIDLLGALPGGSFGDQIDGALGIGANARLRLDPEGYVALRADADWMGYGWDDPDVELRSPFGDVRSTRLSSINAISFLELGPELSTSVLGVRPYLGATAGVAYFLTTAEADRDDAGSGFTLAVRKHDLALAYGGQAGMRIPLGTGRRAISLDLGARFQRSREAEFLRKGDLTVDESGAIHFAPVRSAASLWIFRAGVSVPLRSLRSPQRPERDRAE